MQVGTLIERYGLQPHPEGGWYRELHRSPLTVRREDGEQRAALTAILFLLQAGEISRWHRVLQADETWNFAAGAPLELLLLPPQGGQPSRQFLSAASLTDLDTPPVGEPLAVVPAGWWQAARSLGAWSLVSCCVGPGFDFADFQLLRDLPAASHPSGALADLI